MSILLTERWFNLPEVVRRHRVQAELKEALLNEKFRNVIVAAGRRSYKTERFLKRLFVENSIYNNSEENYLGAPTRQQAKRIFWKDIKELSHPVFVKHVSESELRIEYKSGSVLQVVGLKEFKRVQGGRAHRVGITEYQDCDPGVFSESFEPMLNDTGGICIKEGRPFGKNHLFDEYTKGLRGSKGWASFHWKSSEILTEEQIERAKENLALQDYLREYDASFETEFGRPYYSYSENNNAKHMLIPALPVIVTCDFNATERPMSWVVGQYYNGSTYWVKCFSMQFTNTVTMCGVLDDYLKEIQPRKLVFYGDYAGTHEHSNSSYTDWEIIENYFRNKAEVEKRLKPCLSIRDSIGATNAQLCNALNIRKQFVNIEECLALADDWEKINWKANGREIEDKDPLRGHACRAVDYYNYYEFPLKKKPNIHWSR